MSRYQHCATCNATMHEVIWTAHVRSKQHRDGLRELEVTPLLVARFLLVLSAALTVLSFVAYVRGGYPDSLFIAAVVALVGAVLVGKR